MTLFLFILDILGGAIVFWVIGAIISAGTMVWQDWRTASRRYRMGMGPSPFAYTTREILTRPWGWPGRAWAWMDDRIDQIFDDLD